MITPDEHKRKVALKSLFNIALFESVVLLAVVGVYLGTGNLTYLIGGIIGSTLVFAPMFLKWFQEYGEVMKTQSDEGGHD